MRSKLGDEPTYVLRLEEDSPRYEIHRERRELDLGDRWTEVVIVSLHEAAARQLRGRRLADYLGEELRGQLLGRAVELRVVDQIARGLAQREFRVTPRRFEGVPLSELTGLELEGHGRARLELCYLPPELEQGRVVLAAGGTLVVDDLASIPGLDHLPWSSGRLTGAVDCPALEVAPGSRRGFVPNAAAAALLAALRGLEPQVAEALGRFEQDRRRESDEELGRQLRRLFSDFSRRLPHYELFEVERQLDRVAGTGGAATSEGQPLAEGAGLEPATSLEAGAAPVELEPDSLEELEAPELFPPGPLAEVAIQPAGGELEVGHARRLRAAARDADGRRIEEGVSFHWQLEQGWALASVIAVDAGEQLAAPRPGLDVLDAGRGVRLLAGDSPGTVTLSVLAVQGERRGRASASFELIPAAATRPDLGIPEPHPVHAPGEPWRSRVHEGRWEYNSGHPDYLATVGDASRKLRYIATLLAKELVQRRTQRPEAALVLEQMIEVLSWVERKLSGTRGRQASGSRAGQ